MASSIVEDSTSEGGWTLRTLSLLPTSLWEVGSMVGKKFARCIHVAVTVGVFAGRLGRSLRHSLVAFFPHHSHVSGPSFPSSN